MELRKFICGKEFVNFVQSSWSQDWVFSVWSSSLCELSPSCRGGQLGGPRHTVLCNPHSKAPLSL